MNNKLLILRWLVLFFLLVSCNNEKSKIQKENQLTNSEQNIKNHFAYIDSINESLKWEPIKDDLYINKDGEIGFQVEEMTEDLFSVKRYRTKLWVGGSLGDSTTTFNSFVDTGSFKYLGIDFYKDINSVYIHFTMSDGGTFSLLNTADVNSFKIIDNCYAMDATHVFDYRGLIIEEADVNTFTVNKSVEGCYAKDKNYFYYYGDTLAESEMEDSITKNAIKLLKQ